MTPDASPLDDRRLPSLEALLEAAEHFAREAGALTLRHFGGRVADEAKGDGSPVTLADREAETALRGLDPSAVSGPRRAGRGIWRHARHPPSAVDSGSH
jgi:hypothetical protein